MNSISVRRIMAFFADYVFIVVYGAVLFGSFYILKEFFHIDITPSTTALAILLDFLTLTLPVMLYFILMECGGNQASLGKMLFKLKVYSSNHHEASLKNIIIRNLLKFLPWQLAHIGVRFLKHGVDMGAEPAIWIWILLIVPQLLVMIYFLSIIKSNGKNTVYDRVAGVEIA